MTETSTKVEKIKIRLYNTHFAYVNKRLILELEHQCGVVNFNSWLRQQIFQDFQLRLKSVDDLTQLKELLIRNYYDNAGDWLNEKIRTHLPKVTINTMKQEKINPAFKTLIQKLVNCEVSDFSTDNSFETEIGGKSYPTTLYEISTNELLFQLWNTSNNEPIQSWPQLKATILDALLDEQWWENDLVDDLNNWCYEIKEI